MRSAASCGDQLGYPDEIVGDQVEQEVASDPGGTSMFGLAHCPVLLAPTEDAFDHGTTCLRHAVAVVPGGSSVDSALASVRIGDVVLGHVWRDIQRAELGDVVSGVIGLVLADGDATAAFLGLYLEHDFRRAPLGRSRGMREPSSHRQTIPVLHGHVSHVAELCFLSGGLPVQPAVGIGHAGMGVVLALLSVEVRAIVVGPSPSGMDRLVGLG